MVEVSRVAATERLWRLHIQLCHRPDISTRARASGFPAHELGGQQICTATGSAAAARGFAGAAGAGAAACSIAVVGTGPHIPSGWTTSRTLHDLRSVPGCRIAALVERGVARRSAAARELGVATTFETVAELLASPAVAAGEIAGCFIFSSPLEHYEQALACVACGPGCT